MKKLEPHQTISILANLGVIAGLVLVALELRQTTDAVVGATYQARSETGMQWNLAVAGSELLTDVSMRARELDSLTPEDRMRLQTLSVAAYYRLDGYLFQSERGLLPKDSLNFQFKAEMQVWVPRWMNLGLLTTETEVVGTLLQSHMRPSFARQVLNFVDAENPDLQWLVDRSRE